MISFWASLGTLLLLGILFVTPTVGGHMYMDTVIIPKELDPKELECAHHCLASIRNSSKIYGCYNGCSDAPVKADEDELMKRNRLLWRHATYKLGLICRDDSSVTVRVDIPDYDYPNFVVIQYKVSDGDSDTIYLANNPLGLIDLLKAETSYNITGFGFKGNKYDVMEEFIVNETIISTLNRHKPVQEVTEIKVSNYRIHPDCKSCLYADVHWTPSADYICHYSIAWHDNYNGDLHEIPLIVELEPKSQYEITIGELEFGREYKVAVRSFVHFNDQPKNDFDWRIFITPQCREIFTKHEDILEMCPPLQPKNVQAIDEITDMRGRHIIVTWDKPEPPLPHHYTITIRNLDYKRAPFSAVVDATGDKTEVRFNYIHLSGIYYEATVEAFYANGKRTYTNIERQLTAQEDNTVLIVLMSAFLVIIFISFLLSIGTALHDKIKERTTPMDTVSMTRGDMNHSPRVDIRHNPYRSVVVEDESEEDLPPYIDDSFEVDQSDVHLFDVIGEGHFGTVKKGKLYNYHDNTTTKVAVKMLKDCPSDEEIRKFVQEITIMKSVPKHVNIVSVVGHCTERDEQLLLLTEYCAKGSLLSYLRSEWQTHKSQQARWSEFSDNFINYNQTNKEKPNRDKKINVSSNSGQVNAVDNPAYSEDDLDDFVMVDETHLSMKSLLDMAIQVAEGMKFLAINKVVHRDLAARNVLVNEENVIKIADFGLSRDIHENGMYKKSGGGRVPIKWMALEALSRQLYSTQSDVWSFGVLLYEIITLGCVPYPTVPNDKLLVYLMSGSRMERPPNCSHSLYQLMTLCWSATPSQRPSFDDIAAQLSEEKKKLTNDEFIDLEKLSEDTNLLRDQPRSPYLTPISFKPQYLRFDDSTEDEDDEDKSSSSESDDEYLEHFT